VNDEGQRMVFGKRQHRCYHSENYRKATEKIVENMAIRYGNHGAVVAWQIDNELGGERQRCYCSRCEKAFQAFLKKRYTSIGQLNKLWGTFFWSEEYQDFDQIKVPLRVDNQLWLKHNPSLELDFWRFSSQSITDYGSYQANLIHHYSDKPVTTNTDQFFYGDTVRLDHLYEKLDIAAMDLYSENFCELSFYKDIMRSLNRGPFWIMEYGVNSKELTKELDYLSASDCEFLSFFLYKAMPWGQEQSPRGLLSLTGKPSSNYDVVKQWTHQQSIANDQLKSQPSFHIYYDFESSWSYSIASWEPHEKKFVYPNYIMKQVYRAFFENNLEIGFVYHANQLPDRGVLVLPWKVLYEEALEKRLIEFVERGGKLVVTEDFFTKDQQNVYMTMIPPIFKSVFGWTENDFITGEGNSSYVLLENSSAWILKKDTAFEEWQTFLRDYLLN
jgi:beta-galactosidase